MKTLNKLLRIVNCILVLCFILTILPGCQRQNTSNTPVPSLLKDELEIKVQAISNVSGSYITAGTVYNKSGRLYSVHAIITYYDKNGKVIGTYPTAILDIYPGIELAFFSITADDWSHAASAEVKVTNISKEESVDILPEFEFGPISIEKHDHGTRLHGSVTNLCEKEYSLSLLGVIFDAEGDIKMSNSEGVFDLAPGETREFAIGLLGEATNSTDARVYIESINNLSPTRD